MGDTYTESGRETKRDPVGFLIGVASTQGALQKEETRDRRSIRRHSSRYALFRISSEVVHNYWPDRETGERGGFFLELTSGSCPKPIGAVRPARAVLRHWSAPLKKSIDKYSNL